VITPKQIQVVGVNIRCGQAQRPRLLALVLDSQRFGNTIGYVILDRENILDRECRWL
jgi:hypothetical protein